MNNQLVFIVIGDTGSGKSTFCTKLAQYSGLKVANAGDAIKEVLDRNGITCNDRRHLGELYLSYFNERKLAEDILRYARRNNAQIIDGVRKKSTRDFLMTKFETVVTIFVHTSDVIRRERILGRDHCNHELVTSNAPIVPIAFDSDRYIGEIMDMAMTSDVIVYYDEKNPDMRLRSTNRSIDFRLLLGM